MEWNRYGIWWAPFERVGVYYFGSIPFTGFLVYGFRKLFSPLTSFYDLLMVFEGNQTLFGFHNLWLVCCDFDGVLGG